MSSGILEYFFPEKIVNYYYLASSLCAIFGIFLSAKFFIGNIAVFMMLLISLHSKK